MLLIGPVQLAAIDPKNGTGFVLFGMQTTFPQASFSGSEIFTKGLPLTSQRVLGTFLFQVDARRIPFSEELYRL